MVLRKLKFVCHTTLTLLLAACSDISNTLAASDADKQAEVLINCDEASNFYNFEFNNLTKFDKFSNFHLNNSSQPKTKLAKNCNLENGITVETDFDLIRKDEYEVKGSLDSGRTYTLTQSSMDINIKLQEKVIINIIGVNFLQKLTVSVDAQNIEICQTRSTNHCNSYDAFDLEKPINIRIRKIHIIN